MAGTTNTNTNTTASATTNAHVDVSTNASASVSTATATAEVKLERANRIAVSVTTTGFKADFYRTHKKLATLLSEESGWEADASMNKSALREDFRRFAIEHAEDNGIEWKPQDLRSEENKRIPKYENDKMLKDDACDMLYTDLMELVAKCPHGVTFLTMEAETIVAVAKSAKGTDLSKLGVIDGKYERSGNWAWADVEMLITLTKDGEELYYTTKCQLVSGQLKKPHITQTSFNDSIKESMKEAGIWQEEAPKGESPKVGLGDEEHEGLHMDMTAEEEAKAMAEAEEYLAKTSKPKKAPKTTKAKKSAK